VTENEFVVRLEIPGVSREDLKVFVVGGECVVRGERKPPQCAGTMRPVSLERPWGPFERRFVLPVGSRIDEMKARALEGVLEIRIPVEGIDVPKEQKIDVS
jgi:HSP20 family protein